MKLIMLGSLDAADVDELRNQPVALLTGSVEEIRRAAPLLFESVTFVRGLLPEQCPNEAKPIDWEVKARILADCLTDDEPNRVAVAKKGLIWAFRQGYMSGEGSDAPGARTEPASPRVSPELVAALVAKAGGEVKLSDRELVDACGLTIERIDPLMGGITFRVAKDQCREHQRRESARAREIAEALLDAVEAYADDKYRAVAISTVARCIEDIVSLSSRADTEVK